MIASAASMILYEIWWIRYFQSNRILHDFYADFLGIAVAGATIPTLTFFLLSNYGTNIWLMLAAVIFGIGHIGIHLQHRAENR